MSSSCLSFTLSRRRRQPIVADKSVTVGKPSRSVVILVGANGTVVAGGDGGARKCQHQQQATSERQLAPPRVAEAGEPVEGMSLDQHLKSFLETLWWRESKVVAGEDVFQKEFDALRQQSVPANEENAQEAFRDVNKPKNRYKDIVPFDHSRVALSQYPGVPGSDYVNASLIRGASGSSRAYIAAQGPLPHTVTDFWRMIWESNVSVIVMTCNEIEGERYKCEKYWPEEIGDRQQYGNVTVTLEGLKQVCPDFLLRTLRARVSGNDGSTPARTICQFHYTAWPDHGVPPRGVQHLVELVRLVRDCQPSEALPVLVHCSAGCGRTGTFCAIDYVHGLLRSGKLTAVSLNLFNIILDMRQQRVAMVQTRDQYVLVHKVVGALFEQQLKLLDSHIYQNINTIQQYARAQQQNQISKTNPNIASSRVVKTTYPPIGRLERSKSMGSLEGRIVGKATVIRRLPQEHTQRTHLQQSFLVLNSEIADEPLFTESQQQPLLIHTAGGRLFGATLVPKARVNEMSVATSTSTQQMMQGDAAHPDDNANHRYNALQLQPFNHDMRLHQPNFHRQHSSQNLDEILMKTRRTSSGALWTQV